MSTNIDELFIKNDITHIKGWGRFSGPGELEVDLLAGGKENIKAKNVIIATGSVSNHLPAKSI